MKSAVIGLCSLLMLHSAFGQGALQAFRPKYEKFSWHIPAMSDSSLAEKILQTHSAYFTSGATLELDHQKESPAAIHFHFHQTFLGIPIFGAGILATADRQGKCISLVNNLQDVPPSTRLHGMDLMQLQDWVEENVLHGGHGTWQESRLVWIYLNSELVPGYHVKHPSGNTVHELVFGDGKMDTLHFQNLEVFHHRAGIDTTGNAFIFDPDPLTTAGVTYGGNYTDNFDSDSPYLDAQRIGVTLQDISWNGTNFLLSGPHVQVSDFESPVIAPATSTDGNFLFTRSQSGFEDVMVYHHIDQFQRYVQSLGFTNLVNGPIQADPHGLGGQENSHFVPVGVYGRLGFGEGGVDDAEDADVIIHEYGHALSYAANSNGNSGTERNGLDEGIGDYLAASYSRYKSYNLWKNTFSWDGHNEFWDGRSASDPTLYPPVTPNIYTYGAIWASALMEVYQEIGRTSCDKVLLQAMYSFAPNISLNDAAHLMIDADSLLFGGAHTASFQAAFCRRGIFDGTAMGEECYVGIDDENLRPIEFILAPNPANDRIQIRTSLSNQSATCSIVDLQGRMVLEQKMVGAETEMNISKLPAGAYLVKIHSVGTLDGSKMLIVQH